MENLNTSEAVIKEAIRELYINRLKNLRKWSRKTKQTSNPRLAYLGQHLTSLITGVQGDRTGARGYDLSDKSEIKSCSRVNQLSECNKCEARVMLWEDACPNCGSDDFNIKTDSHWIFRVRSESMLEKLLSHKRLLLVLFDGQKSQKEDKIKMRMWQVGTDNEYVRKFFSTYYENIYKKKVDKGKTPADCNLHPLKFDFYMMNPKLIFECDISIDSQEIEIDTWDTENPNTEPIPTSVLYKSELENIFTREEIVEKVKSLPERERSKFTYKNSDKVKKFNTKKMYTNLFDYVPSEKENMLSIRDKNPVDIKNK